MIPNILSTIKGYGKGYLHKCDASVMIQPMFPAANLAIRKSALQEVGFFDTVCKTSGEDNDLCIRMLKTKWELFYEPRAVVRHKHRTSLRGLLKQWYGYGSFHPHIFKKHTPKCLEIVYRNDKSMLSWSSRRFYQILGIPIPLRILIFITPFYILHAFLGLLFFALITKSPLLFAVAFLGGLIVWLYYSGGAFLRNFIIKRNFHWVPYALIRYLLNWTFVLGAFQAGLKIGVIHFAATRGGESR
jgi:cellulose synthase/poly-beta-1,6-N-acetylglucosamine synthase-like glycosyltransferase